MKRALITLLVAGVSFAVLTLITSNRKAARQAAQHAAWEQAKAERAAELERVSPEQKNLRATASPAPPLKTALPAPAPEPIKTSAPPNVLKPAATTPAQPLQPSGKTKTLQDPVARVALSLAG